MTSAPVLYESSDRIGVLTLNRPDQRNSMSAELLDGFSKMVEVARTDVGIRCLVVTGSGSCFSAGADLRSSLQRGDLHQAPGDASYAMYEPFLRVLDVEVPVIGALNGHAVGGGFGLALLADIRIAESKSLYGANFARLGIHSGLGISFLLPRIVGAARAAELLFTGSLIQGSEAARIGLVSRAVEGDEVMVEALRIARSIVAAAPLAVRGMKRSMRRGLGWEIREAARAEAPLQAATLETADAQEGMRALLEHREPEFVGK